MSKDQLKTKKRKISLLIDGDILIHQIASSIEEVVCWDQVQDLWTVTADARAAKQRVDIEIRWLLDTLNGDTVIIAFTDPKENFRHGVADYYKQNRRGIRKPTIFPELRRYCEEVYTTRMLPTLEADDVLGILATSRTVGGSKIIVSIDKDLMQIPGKLYRPNTGKDEILLISKKEADHWFFTQTLTGDATDGFPGLPGCGPKTAARVLQKGTWDEVVAAYEHKGLNEAEALRQAQLARILRAKDYDLRKKKVSLWTP